MQYLKSGDKYPELVSRFNNAGSTGAAKGSDRCSRCSFAVSRTTGKEA
jgi:hypothetical protein